jgi:ribosomal protein S18 acetylase RimI-like enzyme
MAPALSLTQRTPPMPDTRPVTLRLLDGSPEQMAELQSVLEAAPTYASRVTGLPVGPADAQSTFSIGPPGKSIEDKFVFGIFAGGSMIGCIDVIRGWPTASTAHIGLLLLAEAHQGQGHGRRAYEELEAIIRTWGRCDRVRAGVVRTNEQVLPFWQRLGFSLTGEIKPYRYAGVRSEVLILERPISNAA